METTTPPPPHTPKPVEAARKFTEEFKVAGENLLKEVRHLVHEGNVRRIAIRNEEGHTLLEIPLAIGLVGALLAPVWAAVGAMAAMATGFSIIVERPAPPATPPAPPAPLEDVTLAPPPDAPK
ncbi:MAG: hypothetical protein JWN44_6447 [Myxococcales bacterium]|nr:hypothetical protein [Myxococcales bacterium]